MKHLQYQASESLPVGLLLALSGGMLDSYTFLNRGAVFATVETGNMIMLCLHLAEREWEHVLVYLFPILAFALGILVTDFMRRKLNLSGFQRIHWRQFSLLVECAVILAVAFLPLGSMDSLANILISFTAAVQLESFRKFVGCACATTMCTGNLKSGTELLVKWSHSHDSDSLRKAGFYFGLILFFMVGVFISAILTPLLAGRTVIAACVPYLLAFTLMLRAH